MANFNSERFKEKRVRKIKDSHVLLIVIAVSAVLAYVFLGGVAMGSTIFVVMVIGVVGLIIYRTIKKIKERKSRKSSIDREDHDV